MITLPHQIIAPIGAVFVAAGLLTGCDNNQNDIGWWQGEQQRIELSNQLELKKFRFDRSGAQDFKELQALRQSTSEATASLKSLREQRLVLGEQLQSLQAGWADFRVSTLGQLRQRAMGKTFEKLSLRSGREFVGVSVAAIGDSGVTIRHADGSARLRFADLDATQRVFFGLDQELASVAEAEENKDAAAYEQWVNQRIATLDEKKSRDAESTRREELAAQRTRAQLASQLLASTNNRPLAQPASSVGTYSRRYTSDRSYRPFYRHVYYYNAPDYHCQPTPMNFCPSPVRTPYVQQPPVVKRRKSFADTTIQSIP